MIYFWEDHRSNHEINIPDNLLLPSQMNLITPYLKVFDYFHFEKIQENEAFLLDGSYVYLN